ncbi:Putative phosphate transport protein [Komagataella phaffii CBS 7435]|uniref:Putative phosphate transport protein n=1 Tax=Komagataella phaffii (strain ATCC 76273 / CBS 7435 / CECT 11047 / NRRL Y-11430 / Wegner 21-1) TaxID=981350 RepID=F2QXU3_KOMPC|nr:GQ67_05328T0 [Komagataella phaffii]AOA69601.1 GQ68_05285T0 [Komagataella phaffii GS115]CAH2450401.1 Putative phosphate transport protein [Komagataella phaffii CBS 7435]CCA40221.1 Putative phosphate transport protein [Komagataella phaffii CBS 7435]
MNPAVSNIVLSLVMMQVSRQLDFENESVVFYVRAAYVTTTLIVLGTYLFVRLKIQSKNDLTTLKYVEPANPLSGQSEEQLQITTVKDYDLKQANSAIRSVFTGVAMMGFMHLYMKFTNPLVMQSVSPLKSLFENKIIQIHLLNKPAVGDLKRPFKAAPGLFGQGATDIKTDKQSIDKAEVSGRGGLKEE